MRERRLYVSAILWLATLFLAAPASGQDPSVTWQRREPQVRVPVTVFHSTQSANLPTAETLRRGEWLFEISHRFVPSVSGGADVLWGLDGPVVNRLGLAYAVTDRAMLGIVRSNLRDNLEVGGRLRILESGGEGVPYMVALGGGVAWNTEVPDAPGFDGAEIQAYAQVVADVLLGERLALGLVPAILRNPRIEDVEPGVAWALGVHAQLYLSSVVSVFTEWVAVEGRPGHEHDAGTLGVELETGGHFFKLVLTNQTRMNPTQVLGGAPHRFALDQLRLGFNVTRLLKF